MFYKSSFSQATDIIKNIKNQLIINSDDSTEKFQPQRVVTANKYHKAYLKE